MLTKQFKPQRTASPAETAIRVQGRSAQRQGGPGALHHCAVRAISAADSPSVNDAAGASDHLFLGRDNNFFLRCDDDFFLWCDHDFLRRLRNGATHFHCTRATDASGVPDPFGAFDGNGTAGSSRHQHAAVRDTTRLFIFVLQSIEWLETNRTSFS
ncbi:MAG: hypothetical protein J5X22_20095 [Candidatus Accumulibacter sp.]|uniref:hypothetical protein n=1 Tax=Accumulibacter sp. TaxID=2053492 RepID=UPI001AC50B84|nr:hypothetical protein [Accumulibacter sp.]MBN8516489.1 hypothetical protein [Accumulibacter sp.]MBO3712713.1 hypothetical protein [Accumulibacter sp.]